MVGIIRLDEGVVGLADVGEVPFVLGRPAGEGLHLQPEEINMYQ